jgi:hypothetical protein
MGDRPESPFRVRTSEDKVRRKDLCESVRPVYVLEKLSDVSGPNLIEVESYIDHPVGWSAPPLGRPDTSLLRYKS